MQAAHYVDRQRAAQSTAQVQHPLAVYFGLNVMAKAGHPKKVLMQAKDARFEVSWPHRNEADSI